MSEILFDGRWRNLKISYDSDGVLFIEAVEEGEYEVEDIKEYIDYLKAIVKDDKVLILNDMRTHYMKMSKDVMAMIANDTWLKKHRIANAVVVQSLPNRLIVNFYIKIIKPSAPTKMFSSLEGAKEWLFKQKEEFVKNNLEATQSVG